MIQKTISERWRAARPRDYSDALQFLRSILEFDPKAVTRNTDLGPTIIFSDGSIHRIDRGDFRKAG